MADLSLGIFSLRARGGTRSRGIFIEGNLFLKYIRPIIASIIISLSMNQEAYAIKYQALYAKDLEASLLKHR